MGNVIAVTEIFKALESFLPGCEKEEGSFWPRQLISRMNEDESLAGNGMCLI